MRNGTYDSLLDNHFNWEKYSCKTITYQLIIRLVTRHMFLITLYSNLFVPVL